ncbi:MAG TPA: hypothetical protein VJT69_00060 [Pyrinomonadaceae bacterium]|nr:hypothetical protein [Pyrinomonadaceae bacterium]
MKRMILRVVVLLLTFVLGVAAYGLILRRAVNEAPTPCKIEVVSPDSVLQRIESIAKITPIPPAAPVPAATPQPHYVLDYDPETFNPYGIYYMIETKPKEFANFESIELGLYGDNTEPGYITIYTQGNNGSDSATALFALVTKDRLVFSTSKTLESGVEYRFEGEFLRRKFSPLAGKNTPVLRGVLTRSKNGRTLAEATVSFRFEHLGC